MQGNNVCNGLKGLELHPFPRCTCRTCPTCLLLLLRRTLSRGKELFRYGRKNVSDRKSSMHKNCTTYEGKQRLQWLKGA